MPPTRFKGACSLIEAPDHTQSSILNVLWFQKIGFQVPVSECSQGLTFEENVGRGYLLNSTFPTQWAVLQPKHVEVSSRGVKANKKANDSPGLIPIKG